MEKEDEKQKNMNWFKRNLISLSTLILLIGMFAKQVAWQQEVEDNLKNLQEHRESTLLHMPFQEKMEVFVPRNEYNQMQGKLDLMNDKIDLLLADRIRN